MTIDERKGEDGYDGIEVLVLHACDNPRNHPRSAWHVHLHTMLITYAYIVKSTSFYTNLMNYTCILFLHPCTQYQYKSLQQLHCHQHAPWTEHNTPCHMWRNYISLVQSGRIFMNKTLTYLTFVNPSFAKNDCSSLS